MYRGTTPEHIFQTNIDLTGYRVYVTYAQNGNAILEKTNEDITVTEDSVTVPLTQEDTLKFSQTVSAGKKPVIKMQIRYVTPYGSAGASNIMTTTVDEILKDGGISYDVSRNVS